MKVIHEGRGSGELVTGLLFANESMKDFSELEKLSKRPLNKMNEEDLRPTREQFGQFMKELS